MKNVEEIQDMIFMAQDKIKFAEMFIAHAKAQIHELQELIFDREDQEWLDRIARQNRSA